VEKHPLQFSCPFKKERPLANRDLLIQGSLIYKGDKKYIIKPASLTPLENTFLNRRVAIPEKNKIHQMVKKLHPS
jgi:hypothetical protein